jgi:exopolyphosphatase/guanosine-5'-triphosphate,3'-diphosphate pyrophosphatase
VTAALGPLKLREIKGGRKAVKAYARETMERLHDDMGNTTGMRLFLVGGSWRAIARVDMERREYPLTVLHEYRMTSRQISKTAEYIRMSDLQELRSRCNISDSRMSLVPLASIVLKELMRTFKPKDVAVSSYGIREGMLFEQMPSELRDRDPLVEACRFAESKDARMPGFGRVMYDFVKPLFPRANWQRKRIIKAASLLHDVSWRAHPDYRAEVTFDNATRANLGGLKHYERVLLGLALMNRYTNKIDKTRFAPLFAMLNDDQVKEAEILGKAMRLGAMLWLTADEIPGSLKWSPKVGILTLKLSEEARPLYGEVAEARFAALTNALKAEGKVVFQKP